MGDRVGALFPVRIIGHNNSAVVFLLGGAAGQSAQDVLEGGAEVQAEAGVQRRVDGRVAVAEPEAEVEHGVTEAALAERPRQVQREEGQPAEDEHADQHSQRLRRLRLHTEPAGVCLEAQLIGADLELDVRRVVAR